MGVVQLDLAVRQDGRGASLTSWAACRGACRGIHAWCIHAWCMQGDGVYLDAGLLEHLPLTYSQPRRVLEQLRRHAVLDSERPLADAGPLQPLHG